MKLTIEVQQPKGAKPSLNEEINYRWDRILVTAVGAVSLLALVIWVFFAGGENPEIEQPAERTRAALPLFSAEKSDDTAEAASADKPGPSNPLNDGNRAQQAVPTVPPEEQASLAVSTDHSDSEHSEATAPSPDPVDLAIEEPPAPASTTAQVDAVPGDEPAKLATPTQKNASAPELTQQFADSPAQGLFSGLSTTIHSDRIKRFSLARTVRDKEPVGKLDDIELSRDDVATVFVYSEAVDCKDDTLRYIWTLNGDRIATVKVPVWSARWRSHSSKYVTTDMRGQWKVELRDGDDELLAMSEFRY